MREEGVAWTLSSTRAKSEPLTLEAGKTLTLAAPKGLRFAGQARRKGKALQLGFSLTDEAGHGVSVYRAGHRVVVRFEVLDTEGRVVDRGAMRYG